MLPYTPLHHLLLAAVARPIVLTSGNVSDEPIVYRDDEALDRLGGIADAFLTHDRAIHIRTDDSVGRAFRGRPMLLRRSRGYVPEPLALASGFPRPVLACGAELKNTFCLARDHHAFVSHHIGDLENAETLRSFTEGIEHFRRLFDIDPRVVAHDLHPEYLSTKYALELRRGDLQGVQHHHAHIASCLADNGADGPVIGVAFDGTGYGTDGTIWGGEFLVAGLAGFERGGHLAPVPMPGGAAAIRQPWRMAAAYLDAARPRGPSIAPRRHAAQPGPLGRRHRHGPRGINSPLTSSAGRLFDAAAAILGVRDAINYEGQAAVELEQLADPAEAGAYPAGVEAGHPVPDPGRRSAARGRRGPSGRVPAPVIAARFHHGVAALIEAGCLLLRDRLRPGHGGAVRRRVPEPPAAARDGQPGWRPAASASCCTRASRATTAGSASARPWSPPPGTGSAYESALISSVPWLISRRRAMSRTVIDLDDDLVADVARALGTRTKKETVNTALREVLENRRRAVALTRLREAAADGAFDLALLADKENYRR